MRMLALAFVGVMARAVAQGDVEHEPQVHAAAAAAAAAGQDIARKMWMLRADASAAEALQSVGAFFSDSNLRFSIFIETAMECGIPDPDAGGTM
eukprot:SAG31_NODE_604_length_13629_cov_11.035994_10_plen_94_part_00